MKSNKATQNAIHRIVEAKKQAHIPGKTDKYTKSWTNLYWSQELKRYVSIPE